MKNLGFTFGEFNEVLFDEMCAGLSASVSINQLVQGNYVLGAINTMGSIGMLIWAYSSAKRISEAENTKYDEDILTKNLIQEY